MTSPICTRRGWSGGDSSTNWNNASTSARRSCAGSRRSLGRQSTRSRQQLARDLHDDLGQTLAAAGMRPATLDGSPDPDARATAARVGELISQANHATRYATASLSPPMLFDLGLIDALEWLGEDLAGNFGIQITVVDDEKPKPLSHATRVILYRATRELLINAAKHANADAAIVETELQGAEIILRVADSGVGFDGRLVAPGKGHGMGLRSVRERRAFIGGRVEINATPGDGTVVTLAVPLMPGQSSEQA